MLTYFISLIQRFKVYSQTLDTTSILINQKWVLFDAINNLKIVYIFRANNELLISENGIVSKGNWESLDPNTLLVDTKENSYLYKNGFFDESILALKLDSHDDFSIFVNENNYNGELNSIEDIAKFLEVKYDSISNSKINPSLNKNAKNSHSFSTTSGGTLQIFLNHRNEKVGLKGQRVLLDGRPIAKSSYISNKTKIKYYIENSIIVRRSIIELVKTRDGINLEVEKFFNKTSDMVGKGDIVRINNVLVPDGNYRINYMKYFLVKNGVIINNP